MVSVPPDIFLGLVTHAATSFPASSGDEGLLRGLQAQLRLHGVSSEARIHDEDAWSPEVVQIDRSAILRSIDAELRVESQWRRWHGSAKFRPRLQLEIWARKLHRRRKYLPMGKAIDQDHPGFRMIRRLVNIEMAHVTLLREACDSGLDWALILEDDASGRPEVIAEMLVHFFEAVSGREQPFYVNMSRSFSVKRLGVESALVQQIALPSSQGAVQLVASEKAVTNTVCAVLYRKSFLERLVHVMDEIPVDPVIPIDWKLNLALMDLTETGLLAPGDCWLAEPAPIIQSSMHAS